jgi:hypothetical protein
MIGLLEAEVHAILVKVLSSRLIDARALAARIRRRLADEIP